MSTRSKSRTKTSCHNNDNNNEKARMKLKHISLMNELLFSNSDFFTGFTKRKSQTPNKMCVRNAKYSWSNISSSILPLEFKIIIQNIPIIPIIIIYIQSQRKIPKN